MSDINHPKPVSYRWRRVIWGMACVFLVAMLFRLGYPAYRQRQLIFALQDKGLNVGTGSLLYTWSPGRMHHYFNGMFCHAVSIGDSGYKCSDDDLQTIAELFDLTYSDFSQLAHCGLTQTSSAITDRGLAHLRGNSNLVSVSISSKHITNAGMVHLATLPRLGSLELSNTQVTDAGLEQLLKAPRLSILDLDSELITDASIPMLSRFKHLQILDLSHSIISDAGMATLRAALPTTNVH